MTSGQWYVRLGSEVLGPMADDEFRELAVRGGIQPQSQVSDDKTTWVNAATVSGLIFRPPTPPQAEPRMAPPGTNGFSVGWLVGGIVLGGVGVIVLGILLLVVIGALVPDTGSPNGSPGAATASTAPTQEQIVAEGTYRYWLEIKTAMADSEGTNRSTPQAMAAALRQLALRIRSLPTACVDPDAVQCGISAATVLGNLADYVEQSNNPAILVQAFLRGAAGDPLGTAADILDAQSTVATQLQQIQTMIDNARAVLSSRYGVEFPSL